MNANTPVSGSAHTNNPQLTASTLAQQEIFLIEETQQQANCWLSFMLDINGALDPEKLTQALEHLARQVPLLQTRLLYQDGVLWQQRTADSQVTLELTDLRHHAAPEAACQQQVAQNAPDNRCTDGALSRFRLWQLGDERYCLVAWFHHSLLDVRSWTILKSLLADSYNALLSGSSLPTFPWLSASSLAGEEQAWLTASTSNDDAAFWQEYVSRLPAAAMTQRIIGEERRSLNVRHILHLQEEKRARLLSSASRQEVKEPVIYLSAVALLMRHLTGQETVSLSLPVKGTWNADQPGMTSNVIPLILDLPADATLRQILAIVKQELRLVLPHQRYRAQAIQRQAGLSARQGFGPHVNIMLFDQGASFQDCQTQAHFGRHIDSSDMHFTFWGDSRQGEVDILLDDAIEGHRPGELDAIGSQLRFFLEQLTEAADMPLSRLDELAGLHAHPQLAQSFYALRRRPVDAGVLRWDRQVNQLLSQFYASQWTGVGNSPLPVSKIWLDHTVVTFSKLHPVASAVDAAPGTLLAADSLGWQIAVADGALHIEGFFSLDGTPCCPVALAQASGIGPGSALKIISDSEARQLTRSWENSVEHQSWWNARLKQHDGGWLSAAQPQQPHIQPCWQTTEWAAVDTEREDSLPALLAAWLVYIARDTRQAAPQIGVRLSLKSHPAPEALFASTLPFTVPVDLSLPFSHIADAVSEEYDALIGHLPCPAEWLQSNGENAGAFTLCVMENADRVDTNYSPGNLLTLQYNSQLNAIRWLYNASFLSTEEAERLTPRLQTLLSAAARTDNAAMPAAALPRLTAKDSQLLESWNAPACANPLAHYLTQMFEAQAEQSATAIALVSGAQQLTYAGLNQRANQLAHCLLARGVSPEDRIAFCLERGVDMIIAMLGILKAGAAYVALDPAYPSERLHYILQDAAPACLLTDALGRQTMATSSVTTLTLDAALLRDYSADNPCLNHPALTPQSLAYIIYTSGSTGQPKGVMISHENMVNFLCWSQSAFSQAEMMRTFSATSLNFDLSVYECFAPLVRGAAVHIGDNALALSVDSDITLLNTVPSAAQALLNNQQFPEALSSLNLAGEALNSSLIKRIFAETNIQQLCNLYGPSETTTYSTWHRYMRGGAMSETIGRPIANTRIYLLDEAMQQVPPGSVGEIWIGGAGVALGYFNRPDLTAGRFLDDPFSPLPGARMYRTGDLARYQNDGNLIYLGRNDDQVKIRGFRIEPGEIAARLSEHPDVREAAVTAQQQPGTEPRLIAYVVPQRTEDAPDAAALRAFLAGRLPDYMLPAAWLTLDALPLTPNGKLDRRALPAPDDDAFVRADFEEPQGDAEKNLTALWSELLGVSRIGRRDNFFALGGHSLLAVRLSGRLRQSGSALTVQQIFAHPTLAEMAAAAGHASRDELPAFGHADRDQPLPLSFAQQRLWFLWQLDNDPATYNMPAAVMLHGGTNANALRLALGDLFARHEAWRMVFSEQDGQPFARLLPPDAALPFVHHDLCDQPDHQAQLQRLCEEEAHQPFSLAHGPLVRARLVLLPGDRACLLITQHHIVSDGWSIDVMWRELSACYNARRAGETAALPPLPLQFPDYAAWQRRCLTPQRMAQQADYWYQQLHGAPDLLTLPTDRPRPQQQSYLGAAAAVDLGPQLSDAVRRFSRQHGVTPYMTVLAAWSVVLSRLAGCDDLVIGTPVAGRDRAELEPMIGFLVNTLALRIRALHDNDVPALLAQVRRQVLDGQAHQDLPFEQVVERLNPPRQLAHAPLFQVLLAWQTAPAQPAFDGLTVSPAPDAFARIKFDLELALVDDAHGIHGALRYATALFDAATAQRHTGYLINVLEAMLADAQRPPSHLPLPGAQERQRLLLDVNATPADPGTRCLHQHLEQHAARTPHAVALAWDGGTLSYGELNARANRLAHRLLAEGVRPDDLVALCADRSPQLMIGLLAILKAGAAYLPLDPAYAGERLAYILDDARPALLLADEAGRAALGDTALGTIALESASDDDARPAENPHCAVAPHHLAYVIYTSGSTGQPKGVMVEHRQADRLFHATAPTFGFSERDTWCLFHSFSFDFSVWEIWGAWRYGGRLVIVPAATTRSAPDFVRLVCGHGVTVLNQTPSAFRAFARAEADSGLTHQLRWVIFGGEALETAGLRAWYQRHAEDAPRLVNMYGITETTVHVTWHLLTRADTALTHSPVGRRIADLRLYLLDERQQPVPTGASGELYVGGAGVARGYLNRPELTAERFLPDPFSPLPGARMYRAGDLARYLPDGSLAYLGRNDDQVKIRGFRIEPGEIAARLGEHPDVREAAAIARTRHGEPQLLAYVVTQRPLEDLAAVLRAFLTDRLPAYMIPAAYIAIPELPLTANGKLDRRALPGPDDDAFARSAFEAPQGEVEQALAAIWQELLSVERVSRSDNFFALGGHSLLAVRLMERLRRQQLSASVQAVFTTRTLADLAATLGQQQQEIGVPPLLLTPDCRHITPQMLPLISLSQADIDSLTARLPGGVAAIQDIYGLSPLQEGILFHHLMSDKGDPYLLVAQLRFDDRAALLRYADALDRVVARHDVLRTAFVWEGLSEPAQVVLREVGSVLSELELDDSAPALEQLLARFHPRHYRLDLGQAPLLRLIAARDGDGRWYAVQLWHHLIGDHAALAIQQEEIVAICEGRGESLPPPTPYRNLIAQARLGVSQQEHEQFFRTMLGDIDTPTLPFGLSDVHADGKGVSEAHLALPDALSRGLREQARQLGVGLASLCHLAWGQVLAHTSGNTRVVFGTVLLGRLQAGPEADRILGLVINTLPLRLDIDQRGTREAVQETHAALSRLLGHEHASLTLAQRCSGIAAPAPLFSALLNYRHNQESEGSLPMPAGTTLLSGEERTNYPFVMAVDDDGLSLSLSAQMTSEIDPEHACGWMAQALTSLLAALEKEPLAPVRQLRVVPAAERTLLLDTLNQPNRPYPADRCLHDEFEMQAAANPQAVALTCGEQRLSYGELNASANRLAHYLIEVGVGPDRRVALCVSRSPSMIVAMLAILKAGGAYVPLDPSYPADRLAYIIEDAQPVMLLHDATGRAALGEVDVPALSLDNSLPGSWPQDNPQRHQILLTTQHLAYILYTSGSTGKPKGVMLDHAAVQCRLDWMQQAYGFCADDVFLQKTTFNFDLSVWEIFCSLQCGAQLALASDADVKDPQRMADLVSREKVTIAQFVPSTLAPFLATQSADNASPLRLVIFGGEALTPEHLKRCQSVLPRVAFRNMYGPTEAAIDALFWPCPDNYDGSQIAIGRPMDWTAAYVLDEQGDPVPFGAVGELYLGGAGVARGYFNRADLTAERFLDDPFSPLPGARMYRTGDLARYLADGNLVYLGRNDDQVKIRGFRIEPGEIAARLSEHPDVREAAVTAQPQPGTEPRLVAYVVPQRTEDAPDAAALRDFLAARLPDYMLPAAWLTLDALPLTPNGKLDRRALPAPDDDAFARAEFEEPQGDAERALAALWSELLGVTRVGRRDNFFALGGHSLLAVRLSGRLRQSGGGALPVNQIFARPLLAEMASAVSAAPRDDLPTFIRADRDQPLPLSFAQQRLWFLRQLEEDPATYNMPAAVTLHGDVDADALHLALGDLFARHEAWRMVFSEQDGQPFARLLPPDAALPFVHHDLRDRPDHQAQLHRLCEEEAHQPFSLSHGPLVRARLVRLPDDRCCLLITQHHIVSDGWSVDVMWRELSACYNARRAGLAPSLPPLPLQFPDYAAWQRRWLTPDRLSQQADYWYQQLHGAPELLLLPTDRPRPARQCHLGAATPVDFGPEFSAALRRFSRRHGVTPYMTVLAAWSVVLGRLAGCDDLVIGTPVAGRDRAELEPMIGFLVNTLALRIRPQHDTDVPALLDQVRRQVLDGQAHQDLPFEQVVERLNPPRQLAHAPLFQVLLAWQTAPARPAPDGLGVSPAPDAYARIKFDLELSLVDDAHGIHGALRYATALFDAATAQRHVGYLMNVLEAMLAQPQQPTRLPVLGQEERQRLLLDVNATAADPGTRRLHQHLEQHAAHSPLAVALAWDGGTLSYGELNARANRLAHRLLAEGVQPDDLVAICASRSPETIGAILAVLKAGAAWLPLDPDYPADRLAYILDDARPVLILADDAGRIKLGNAALNAIALERAAADDAWPAENPDCAVAAQHLAYVIYTSGSTGQPKGVMIEHQQLTHLCFAQQQMLAVSPHSRVLQFASISFDASVFELAMTFSQGARLTLVREEVRRDAAMLMRFIQQQGITHATLPPALFNGVDAAPLAHAECLVFAGEAPGAALLNTLGPHTRVLNAYGPTEAAVCATAWRADRPCEEGYIPIGQPIANGRIYLLDDDRQPVPTGATGEIYIGGLGVARGYLNQPELTGERFLCDPFSPQPDARMYRSGDLARYLPDGSLAYLGRNDDQVKIRGFRIEPGEIAARLGEHPDVREAVVIARKQHGEAQLIAYVTLHQPCDALAETLRDHLQTRLPDWMIPAAYIAIPELPLTANGKLDRRALPGPDDSAFARSAFEAPDGEIEQALAGIWQELLNVERVGRFDNFFALGGHSLLAVRLMERLRRLQLSASVQALFTTRTLAELAATLGQAQQEVSVPPRLLTPDCRQITPEMLPLISLRQTEIDRLTARLPGGVAAIQDIYGLSPLQEGILFHHLLATGGDPYLLLVQLSFDSHAALRRYAAALDQVVARHDVLRTAFVWEGLNEPAQVVLREVDSVLTELELDDGAPALEQLLARYDLTHFRLDLSQPPLVRLIAARGHDGRWYALQMWHHLIGDHSTLAIQQQEIAAIYAGQGDSLPPPTPYRNLIAQARLGVSQQEHEQFFRGMLGDISTPTLPFGLTGQHNDASQVTEAHQRLPGGLNQRLRDLARRQGVSLASLCHLAWGQVLAHTSGNSQVVFGTVLLGRLQGGRDAESTMGLFINTLPLRLDIDQRGVRQALEDTHKALSELLMHEHASLALAQRCSGIAAPAPLFSALLNYRHSDTRSAQPTPQGMQILDAEERTNYPFVLSVEDFGDALGLTAQTTAITTPERVCGWMTQALTSMADALEKAPDSAVRSLDILPVAERNLLLNELNQTRVAWPTSQPVQALFEQQAAENPAALALTFEEQTLSYGELNSRANRLAHALLARGVGPDSLVAICAARSPQLMVALLAVLKTGAAYVPLDPDYPEQRLHYILQDAAAPLLLADEAGRTALGEHQVDTIALDMPLAEELPQSNPPRSGDEAALDNLAYVIYTSGSTGNPKGAGNSHRSLLNRLLWAADEYRLDASDRVLQKTPFGFDVSVWELFLPLITGSSLAIAKPGGHKDPAYLAELIEQQQVTTAHFVPSMLALFIRQPLDRCETSLRRLIFSGEALPAELLKEVMAMLPAVTCFNHYGPTEAAIDVTSWRCHVLAPQQPVPIGKPIANSRIYLLNDAQQPVPFGASGELYIAGTPVARGYHHRAELTAERFLPDPFSNEGGGRMYRTGDLARYQSDGSLVYLGRNDDQVKIRGLRIEPGEIAALIQAHPQVDAAAVVVDYRRGEPQLVAYLVLLPHGQLSTADLRQALNASLPDYMIPAAWMMLDSLPLSPNGKLARDRLPLPDEHAFIRAENAAPATAAEAIVADIWGDLLDVEQPGRFDNFFDLGGHSLLAVRAVERLRPYGSIGIDTLFAKPVLWEFAAVLAAHDESAQSRAVAVRSEGKERPVFFMPTGLGDYTYAFRLAREISTDCPIYALPWPESTSPQATTLRALAKHMVKMVQEVQPEGPYTLFGYSSGGLLAHEIGVRLHEAGEKVALLGLIDTLAGSAPAPAFNPWLVNMFLFNAPVLAQRWDSSLIEELMQLDRNTVYQRLKESNMPETEQLFAISPERWQQSYHYQQLCSGAAQPPVLPCVHLFAAEETLPVPDVDPLLLADAARFNRFVAHTASLEDLGWSALYSDGQLSIEKVSGDHASIMSDKENRSVLAQRISQILLSRH